MKIFLFIYGLGGTAKEIFDIATKINLFYKKWKNIYFLHNNAEIKTFLDTKVFYIYDILNFFDIKDFEIVIANGDPFIRENMLFDTNNYNLGLILDPSVVLSKNCFINKGSIFCTNSIVNMHAKIGKNCHIGFSTIISHDCIISENCVILSNVFISGNVKIGKNTFVGACSSIRQNITIGDNVIIGMSSNVLTNIDSNCIVYGNPAKIISKNNNKKIF